MKTKTSSGFTLLEVMITVAIVGILSAIAIPSYSNHVIRSNLVDMTNGLTAMGAQMELYFQDNRTYIDAGDFSTPCQTLNTARYSITCASTATTYTLTGTGVGNISVFTFTLIQSGARATTATKSGWGAVPAACWHVEEGGSC